MLSEISQAEKDKLSYSYVKANKTKPKLTDTENSWMIARGKGWGDGQNG